MAIKVIENNHKEEGNSIFSVVCPHCGSKFEFDLEDLKFIEKCPNGKRVIDCPCCKNEFNTAGISTKVDKQTESKENVVKEDVVLRSEISQFSDVSEVIVDGLTWWKNEGGWHSTRPEDRHVSKGDVIIYREHMLCKNDSGVLVVKSFDFDSDAAARCVVGSIDGTYYGGFAPMITLYRIANDFEVNNFLKEFSKYNKSWKIYFNELLELDPFKYKDVVKDILDGVDE